jgi:hypothetical protein
MKVTIPGHTPKPSSTGGGLTRHERSSNAPLTKLHSVSPKILHKKV